MIVAPHYVRNYRSLMRRLRRESASEDEAVERAVGGHYIRVGQVQADLVRETAPAGPFTMVDVGCGSGRAAFALREEERLSYLGIDVVPDLIDYARAKADRADWRFELISDIAIPAEDASADIILIMSVFTHLKPGEIKTYLAECVRVLKLGGRVIASYLERDNERHRTLFHRPLKNRISRLIGRDVMVSFTTKDELAGWMQDAGLVIDRAIGDGPIGQHVLIGRKAEQTKGDAT